MTLDQFVSGLVYLVAVFILFAIGKWVYDRLHPKFELKVELFEKDNVALGFAMVGYYLGLVFALGGVLDGPSIGIVDDLIDIFFFGLTAIVLLNFSAWLMDKIVLRKFVVEKEIIEDRNAGMGVVAGANYIAVGLVIAGAISGEGGDLVTTAVFWIIGQAVLILASFVYEWITRFNVQEQLEKDNVAVGVAYAGVLLAIGMVVKKGLYGDFYSWYENLLQFAEYALFGLVLIPVVRWVTDLILVPGVTFKNELVDQEKPNVGAAAIEAFSYIAAALLLGWVV
ncbi:MAG: DUF350 domain-containing protein [Calditrichia bacterium]